MMKCPICTEKIDHEDNSIFDHIYYQHGNDQDTRTLILATLEVLSCMDIKEMK